MAVCYTKGCSRPNQPGKKRCELHSTGGGKYKRSDETRDKLLEALENGSMTLADWAEEVGVSTRTVLRHARDLEATGVIKAVEVDNEHNTHKEYILVRYERYMPRRGHGSRGVRDGSRGTLPV